MRSVDDWKLVLRDVLREALRARDSQATSVLRETLAAIDNAEAQDASLAPTGQSGVIAGAVTGLGAGEVARRVLTPEQVTAIVSHEVAERREAAASFDSLGRAGEADTLRRQAELLESLLAREAAP